MVISPLVVILSNMTYKLDSFIDLSQNPAKEERDEINP